jgi:hypothetical protein
MVEESSDVQGGIEVWYGDPLYCVKIVGRPELWVGHLAHEKGPPALRLRPRDYE